jgi:uncharacterized protein Yka (UPF0111/DUF47 family)
MKCIAQVAEEAHRFRPPVAPGVVHRCTTVRLPAGHTRRRLRADAASVAAHRALRVRSLFGAAPDPDEFYELFRRAGANVAEATRLLSVLMREWPEDGSRHRLELKELEEEGDRLTHSMVRHLHERAAAPFPVAEAPRLISGVDDVLDFVEEAGDFMGLYRVEASTDQAVELVTILDAAGRELAAALALLHDFGSLRAHLVALDRLEQDGDRVHRAAPSALFDAGIDPMVVVRWKDIYERLEAAIDAAARVGHTLEGLVVGRA